MPPARFLASFPRALALGASVGIAACSSVTSPTPTGRPTSTTRALEGESASGKLADYDDSGVIEVPLSAQRSSVYALALSSGRIFVDGTVERASDGANEESSTSLVVPPDLLDPFERTSSFGPKPTPVEAPFAGAALPSGRIVSLGARAAAVWSPETGEAFEIIEPLPENLSRVVALAPKLGRERALFVGPAGLWLWSAGAGGAKGSLAPLAGAEKLASIVDVTVFANGALVVEGSETADEEAKPYLYDEAKRTLVPTCSAPEEPAGCAPPPVGARTQRGTEARLISGSYFVAVGDEGSSIRSADRKQRRGLPYGVWPQTNGGHQGHVVANATGGVAVLTDHSATARLYRPDLHPTVTMIGALPGWQPIVPDPRPGSARAVAAGKDTSLWDIDLRSGRLASGPRIGGPAPMMLPGVVGRSIDALAVDDRGRAHVLGSTPMSTSNPAPHLHVVEPGSGHVSAGRYIDGGWSFGLGTARFVGGNWRCIAQGCSSRCGPALFELDGETAQATEAALPQGTRKWLPLAEGPVLAGRQNTFSRTFALLQVEPPAYAEKAPLTTFVDADDFDFFLGPRGDALASVTSCTDDVCEAQVHAVDATSTRLLATAKGNPSTPFVLNGEICVVANAAAGAGRALSCIHGADFETRVTFPSDAGEVGFVATTADGNALFRYGTGPTAGATYDASTRALSPAPAPLQRRKGPLVAALADGSVLVAGGADGAGNGATAVEALDATDLTSRALEPLAERRRDASATLLGDGRLVIAGGASGAGHALASTELRGRDGKALGQGPALATARARHAEALVGGDRIVFVGGDNDAANSLELWSPTTGVVARATLKEPRVGPCALVLDDGSVLVAGGRSVDGKSLAGSAETFDPKTLAAGRTLALAPLGICKATRLTNTRILLTSELHSHLELDEKAWTTRLLEAPNALPAGRGVDGALTEFVQGGVGLVHSLTAAPFGALRDDLVGDDVRAVVSGTGAVVAVSALAAAAPEQGPALVAPLRASSMAWWPRGATQPELREAPAHVESGRSFEVKGLGFRRASAAFATSDELAEGPPVAVFRRTDGSLLRASITRFDDTSLELTLPPVANHGPGWLHVIVDGVPSRGLFVHHAGSASAAGCTSSTECSSGFCVDNVCCDTQCSGSCVACAARQKGTGIDGVCGPVLAGTNPREACAADLSNCRPGACDGAGECARSEDGTSCASSARCIAGVCTRNPIEPARCSEDGLQRIEGERVQSCGRYVCRDSDCLTSCESRGDCAPGSYCNEAVCSLFVTTKQGTGSPRCSAVAGLPSSGTGWVAIALCLALGARRRRHHS